MDGGVNGRLINQLNLKMQVNLSGKGQRQGEKERMQNKGLRLLYIKLARNVRLK